MAPATRQDPAVVIDQLLQEPWRYDFFQALRLIESSRPELPRIGQSRTLGGDSVRFGQFLSLAFASSTLEQAQVASPGGRPKMVVRFTGLTGPNAPMPLRLTEFLWNRVKGNYDTDLRGTKADTSEKYGYVSPRDSAALEFLDIFHHRLISLFYRAWAVAQKTVDLDRPEDRTFAEWIASLAGLGMPDFDGMDAVPTLHKTAFAGHLSCQTRHPQGLRDILRAYFDLPAEVINFWGHWMEIPQDQHCRLGQDRATGVLGRTCVVGARVWDRQLKFRVVLGPMGFAKYQTFLQGASGHARLHSWVDFYARREFYWDAVIILKKEEIPPIRLGAFGQLGRTCWVKSGASAEDSRDYIIRGGGLTPADNT